MVGAETGGSRVFVAGVRGSYLLARSLSLTTEGGCVDKDTVVNKDYLEGYNEGYAAALNAGNIENAFENGRVTGDDEGYKRGLKEGLEQAGLALIQLATQELE